MTIGKKIGFGFFGALLLILLIGGISIYGVSDLVSGTKKVVYGNNLRSEMLQREIDHLKWADALNSYLQGGGETKLNVQTNPTKCAFGKWYGGNDRKMAQEAFPDIKKYLKEIDKYHIALHHSAIEIEKAMAANDSAKAKKIYESETIRNLKGVQGLLKNINDSVGSDVDKMEKSMLNRAGVLSGVIVIIAIFSGVVALLMGLILPKVIIAPIRRTIDILSDISTGEGDLTKRLPMPKRLCSGLVKCGKKSCPEYGKEASCWDTVGSNAPGEIHCPSILSGKYKNCTECSVMQSAMRNEMDELSGWFNTLMGKVSEIIRQVKKSATSLASASEEFSVIAGELTSGAEEMTEQANTVASASEEISVNVDAMAQSCEDMNSNAKGVSGATEQIAGDMNTVASAVEQSQANLSSVAAASEEMASTVEEIARNTESSRAIADNAVASVEKASSQIQRLSEASHEINMVIETIEDIAEQTKLLALNATIEAARAGESGKGFAVVANEVKELARQTGEATEDIRARIEAMQESTQTTVKDIGEIEEIINQVSSNVGTIAAAVEQQSVTVKDNVKNLTQATDGVNEVAKSAVRVNDEVKGIADNVSKVSSGVEEVARQSREAALGVKEVSASIQGVSGAADNTSATATQVSETARELSEMATELLDQVGQFKV